MKDLKISLKVLAVLTVLTGVLYPALVTFAGRIAFTNRAGGSLIGQNGGVVGSALLAQEFSKPGHFWARPSAVKYDGASSGASNLSLTSAALVKAVKEREAQGAVLDLRYASASGLDPHVSPEAALAQVGRVSKATGRSEVELRALVQANTEGRQFGCLGEKRVNVLRLNLALDALRK